MKYSPENEQGIIQRIRKGDNKAYQLVFYRYYEPLCHYALNFTPDKDQVKDIVQEVFLKLWNKKESLYLSGSLKAYLYRMTYNQFVTTFRKEKRYQEELDLFKMEALQPLLQENEETWQLKLNRVKEALDSLPERCREIFILNKRDGLKHKEIAEKLGISPKTVENQIGKASKALKKKLSDKTFYLLCLIRKSFGKGQYYLKKYPATDV
ncbi:RNA polymerase sigma factor [Flavobacterium sp.]|uniref:RNA polymerase sigma factor n=1 Tax=Flavobacterium sp. TaxID=239 RepID=UPI003A94AB5C